jgi:6-phosphogluconolactonase
MTWVGTYREKGGQGLCPLSLTSDGIDLGTPTPQVANASYATWSPQTRTAYFVNEQEQGRIAAWSLREGEWQQRGSCETGGALPCYVALHPARSFLAVANYGSGSLALIALDPASGEVRGLADLAQHSGRGPHDERQSSPHVHCTVFDEEGAAAYAVDLGLDRIFRYPLTGGRFGERDVAFEAPAGSGPRHLLLLPNHRHALLLSELSAELMLLERQGAHFRLVDRVPSAPGGGGPDNAGGHLALAPDGRVLVSNRGHDSLAAFVIESSRLRLDGWRPAGGVHPRHFVVRGDTAIVANEKSGEVTAIALPGAPETPPRKVSVPGAAFIFDEEGHG